MYVVITIMIYEHVLKKKDKFAHYRLRFKQERRAHVFLRCENFNHPF